MTDGKKKGTIIVTGQIASGKTTTATTLAKELGFDHFYPGRLFREEAQRRGMNFAELHELMKTDHSIDKKIDKELQDVLANKTDIVVEGRMAPYFCPEAFKVFLVLEEEVALERLMKDLDNPDRETERVEDAKEVLHNMQKRLESEMERYKKLYDIDNHMDSCLHDLVVDTGKNPIDEVVQQIIKGYQEWL